MYCLNCIDISHTLIFKFNWFTIKFFKINIVLRIQFGILSVDRENKLDENIKYAIESKVISA